MNSRKKILLIPFALFPLLLSSCAKNEVPPEELSTYVWSTYSTCKVIQQTYRNDKYTSTGKNVSIQMMRGEKETGQLIVTSNLEVPVNLTYGELKNSSGTVLPSNKVQIYFQKYVKVDVNMHGGDLFENGDHIPDFLLPMEKAVEYKENYVSRNGNQGFTIEIDSEDVDAGIYTGNFKLTINGVEQEIPVRVEVWDFEYEGKSKIKSCWLTYAQDLFGYEYDSSDEKMETYLAFTSEYKASPYIIQTKQKNNPTDFCDQMERLFKIKNYNTVIVPYDFQLNYTYGADDEKPAKFIEEIARRCTDENFYLDYTVFYPSTYDEADADRTRPKAEASPNFFKKDGEYQKTLQGAYNNLVTSGFFTGMSLEKQERYRQAILNIPAIFTNVGFIENWIENLPATYCPYESLLENTKFRERYIDSSDRCGNNYWTYTCTDPDYPYPSHHLDDDNLSMRVLGWMEKSYNIGGYLYYETCLFPGHNPGQYHNQYETGLRYITCNGDGFILYPGNYYGSDKPFPSTRLVTYRDGLEDYDMLCVYENLLNEQANRYGLVDFDAKDYINDLYDSLFYNAISYTDHSLLVKARQELARRILDLKKNNKVFFASHYDNENNQNYVDIYSQMMTLTVPSTGEQLTGERIPNGYAFHIATNDTRVEVMDYDLNSYVYNPISNKKLTTYQSGSISELISKTDANKITPVDSNTIELEINSEYCDVDETGKPYVGRETRKFNPYIEFKVDNLGNAKYLEFEYENNGDCTLDFNVQFTKNGSTNKKYTYEHSCAIGKKKKLTINLEKSPVSTKEFNTISIRFTNYRVNDGVEELLPTRKMVISNLYAKGSK